VLALEIALALLAVPPLVAAVYLLVLALAARAPRAPAKEPPPPRVRFDIVVPARNEEAGIAATIASLHALDYPPELVRVLVVADNCTDQTAARAELAGAAVMVRDDPDHRGKGFALAAAFDAIERDGRAEAVVVVDADTKVSPNLLRAFAHHLTTGARAVQASYGVQNPEASWRTRLMAIALALFHVLRSLGRERLGLSAGLRGNGMAISLAALHAVPYRAFSIVEDVEYGLALGEAGIRVRFAPEAQVLGEMVSREGPSRSQRRRWERGRRELARTQGPRLLWKAIVGRDPVLLDLALDVLVPPLAALSLVTLLGALVALACAAAGGAAWPAIPWIAATACLAVYVLRGWAISGAGGRGLVDLLVYAPAYAAWKIALSLKRPEHRRGEWVRTEREAHHGA
jgi:cellulose synthase/poly-beta-1,6-N-acetylglucosamine synthase-like glycosyltransferase